MENDTVFESQEATGETAGRSEVTAKRAVLAGIGAIASACDTAEDTFGRFVDRGERARDEWQSRSADVRRQNAETRGRMREYFRTMMDSVFDTLNVPSKTDVDALNVKLNVLNRKIDDLRMEGARNEPAAPEPPVTPAP